MKPSSAPPSPPTRRPGPGPARLLSRVTAVPAALAREPARPHRVRDWPHAWWLAVATVCLGAFMGQLDASVVTLTYPALRARFGANLAGVEWVSLAYLLTLVVLLVPIGRFSDAHGRKLMYLYGFLVFTLASAACATAPTLGALTALRVAQAAGAALLQANSVALVTTSAPPGRMRAALGVQAGAQALGLALGPTLGGLIVSRFGWRWVFLVNVPVGVLALAAGYYLLPRTRTHAPATRFDWPGLALLTTGTVALLLALGAASGLALPLPVILALSLMAAGCGYGLARRVRRAPDPLADPEPLATPQVAAGLAGALGGYLVLFGPLVFVPVELTAHGMSLAGAGLTLTALPAGFAAAALAGERLLPRAWSDRRRAAAGCAAALAALAAMFAAPLSPLTLIPALGCLGLGLGVFTPANNALVMAAIPKRLAATGGGLVNVARGLGTALGVALVTLSLHLAARYGAVSGSRAATGLLALVAVSMLIANAKSRPAR